MKKKALIIGISGQDGSYLAQNLINKGYEVWGSSRDSSASDFTNLSRLSIKLDVKLVTLAPTEFRSVYRALNDIKPDEVYYLAAQSSVGLSFELPSETMHSIVLGALNVLEVARMINDSPRLYFAGSSECYGDTGSGMANELSPFNPQSPYAVAKASMFWLVKNYRSSYGLFACTGILFNHESSLRPSRYVTKKIVEAARRIASGSDEILSLGNIDIYRDWGFAPEFVEAIHMMLQLDEPNDFVLATGQINSLKSFVKYTFECFDLNWENHVVHDQSLLRPNELNRSCGDSSMALRVLGWSANKKMRDVIEVMVDDTLN